MKNKIVLSADSACDIGSELTERLDVRYYPFHITLDGKNYRDGADIFPDDIYEVYYKKGTLPKTAAIGVGEYLEHFRPFVEEGFEVIHLNLSSALSCAHQNCILAARELGNVYPIDSRNLSSGIGLLALEAGRMIENGRPAKETAESLLKLVPKLRSSFVIDTLKFLKAGGRCSALASIGATLFKIKPCIEVDSGSGNMYLGKKYRGEREKVLAAYSDDVLSDYKKMKKDELFVVHSGVEKGLIDVAADKARNLNYFGAVHIARAGCTISAHCGPNTLGIMYSLK